MPVMPSARHHKTVVIGAGSAGLNVSHQLLRSGRFAQGDIAVVDPAEWHHYQPGWTLVGAGLKTKQELRRPLKSLLDTKLKFYNHSVETLSPDENLITLGNGDKVSYDQLVVAPGICLDFEAIRGLSEALANPDSNVASTYNYDFFDKVFTNLSKFRQGAALFTQPTGVIKCAVAPQKIMWLGLDKWKMAGLYNPDNPSGSPINITFATGLPVMFGVPKYSIKLNEMRELTGVEGLFQHDLLSIDGNMATFRQPDDKGEVKRRFDFLHAVPKMRPHTFVKNSPLADEAGFNEVNDQTTRHKEYANVWGCGDSSSLPTSKIVAAITGQAPVLMQNLLRAMDCKETKSEYDGYTSCPVFLPGVPAYLQVGIDDCTW
jgi:eukaryotic sulfide quinone oxidoreductase